MSIERMSYDQRLINPYNRTTVQPQGVITQDNFVAANGDSRLYAPVDEKTKQTVTDGTPLVAQLSVMEDRSHGYASGHSGSMMFQNSVPTNEGTHILNGTDVPVTEFERNFRFLGVVHRTVGATSNSGHDNRNTVTTAVRGLVPANMDGKFRWGDRMYAKPYTSSSKKNRALNPLDTTGVVKVGIVSEEEAGFTMNLSEFLLHALNPNKAARSDQVEEAKDILSTLVATLGSLRALVDIFATAAGDKKDPGYLRRYTSEVPFLTTSDLIKKGVAPDVIDDLYTKAGASKDYDVPILDLIASAQDPTSALRQGLSNFQATNPLDALMALMVQRHRAYDHLYAGVACASGTNGAYMQGLLLG
jgi:hypothetical protein